MIADDITGANDIGCMAAQPGYVVDVYLYRLQESLAVRGWPDAVVLDTNSRYDSSQEAYTKVRKAAEVLRHAGAGLFYKKICSALRGNVGAELDGMLDALQQDFCVVVAGFPKNGRTTRGGIHYIHGTRLEDSSFRHDPMHPMRESRVTAILESQTDRVVELLDYGVVERGSRALRSVIEEVRRRCNYVVLDVTSQQNLVTIAHAVGDRYLLAGSSALAEELAHVLGKPEQLGREPLCLPEQRSGVLLVVGSLTPESKSQVQHWLDSGRVGYELDTGALLDGKRREAMLGYLVEQCCERLCRRQDVLLYSTHDAAGVAFTRDLGFSQGLTSARIAQTVSQGLAEVAGVCQEQVGLDRLLVAGGDTAAAVCGRLGIGGMRIGQEIAPGVPWGLTLSGPSMVVVLKAGSFGASEFFADAVKYLQWGCR